MVWGYRIDLNGSFSWEHGNELSGFIKTQEIPLSALQFLASNEGLVLLIQDLSSEDKSRTHPTHRAYEIH